MPTSSIVVSWFGPEFCRYPTLVRDICATAHQPRAYHFTLKRGKHQRLPRPSVPACDCFDRLALFASNWRTLAHTGHLCSEEAAKTKTGLCGQPIVETLAVQTHKSLKIVSLTKIKDAWTAHCHLVSRNEGGLRDGDCRNRFLSHFVWRDLGAGTRVSLSVLAQIALALSAPCSQTNAALGTL